jgi:hypothetical protein
MLDSLWGIHQSTFHGRCPMDVSTDDAVWFAILGPIGRGAPIGVIAAPHDRTRALDRAYSLGSWTIRPGDKMLVEYVRPEPHSLFGTLELCSWPIIVEGQGDADLFNPEPFRQLHRLSALLALAWVEPWQVRSAPTNAAHLPAVVPDSWPYPEALFGDHEPQTWRDPVPLPLVVIRHWTSLEERSRLDNAVSMWHQGILTQELHPSLALVAFTAAIDAVGQGASSRGRVREAIRTHGSPELAAVLEAGDPYGQRSATVHSGTLHHFEQYFGIAADIASRGGNATSRSVRELLGLVTAARSVARATLLAELDVVA